jgi:hypothetical protein
MYRYTLEAEDTPWTTLVRGLEGFLVVRYGTAYDTAYAADDNVLVFPCTFGERKPLPTEANGGIRFSSHVYVTSQPELDGVVTTA